ncbi:MAG: hypothetical protein D6725_13600 [Planctomycetota bacterium]|nr:MAG: hypothetical protein D6725_13600 [Planctomycetota bacterium]
MACHRNGRNDMDTSYDPHSQFSAQNPSVASAADSVHSVVEEFRTAVKEAAREGRPIPPLAEFVDRVPLEQRKQLLRELASAALFGEVDDEVTIRLQDLVSGLPPELAGIVHEMYASSGNSADSAATGQGGIEQTPWAPTRDDSLPGRSTGAFGSSAVSPPKSDKSSLIRLGELQRVHYRCLKVYLANAPGDQVPQEVAILRLNRPLTAEETAELRTQTMRLAQSVDAHLQPAREASFDEATAAFLAPLIELIPLKRWKNTRRPAWDELAAAVADIAEHLDRLHSQGFVHGLINSSTVGVTRGGRAVVRDAFPPLIHRLAAETDDDLIPDQFHFLPPERLAGTRVVPEPQDDVYGLGIILYELCTGAPPFPVHSLGQYRKLVTDKEAPPLRVRNPRVPAELEAICLRCLEIDPQRRTTGAADLAKALRTFSEEMKCSAAEIGSPIGVGDSTATVELHGQDTAHDSTRSQSESSWASVLSEPRRSVGSLVVLFAVFAALVATLGYLLGRSGAAVAVPDPANADGDRTPKVIGKRQPLERLAVRLLVTPPFQEPFTLVPENDGAGLQVHAPNYPPRFLALHAYRDAKSDYEIEATFTQADLYGGFGIFFGGARNAKGEYELHCWEIDSFAGQPFARVLTYRVGPGGDIPSTHTYCKFDLPKDSRPQVRLGVRLERGRLAAFLLDGQPVARAFEDFTIQRRLMKLPDTYTGISGFRFQATDVHVTDLRINGERYGFEIPQE